MTPAGIFGGLCLLLAVYCAVDPLGHSPMAEFPDFETVEVKMPAWSEIPLDWDHGNLLQKSEIKFLDQVQGPESMVFDPMGLGKYWLKGEKAGTSEVMAVLPGHPDNTRTNDKGEFWVAIHCRRTKYSHILGMYPKFRKIWLKLPISAKINYLMQIGGHMHAAVVKCSPEGKILQVLEDRQGKVFKAISEVEERDGKLWMGSVLMSFVAVYQLE